MAELPTGPIITVSAVDHPVRDAWVDEQAVDYAARNGFVLGAYLGRERDVHPSLEGRYGFHVFAAAQAGEGSGT